MPELEAAFYLLCTAVALGGGLAIHFMRGREMARPPWLIAAAHGGLGSVGLAVLLAVLWRGLPPSRQGVSGFGPAAAVLLALALVAGLGIVLAARRGRRPPGLLVALHASLAIAGFVVLWTVVSLG